MKTCDTISAKTHAQFLNKLLHLNYKSYMRCTYDLHNDCVIWMIRLDGVRTSTGWVNSLTDWNNTIIEKYVGNQYDKLPSHKIYPLEKRAIFAINESNSKIRSYVFMGLFELDKKSTNDNRIWRKISDTYYF